MNKTEMKKAAQDVIVQYMAVADSDDFHGWAQDLEAESSRLAAEFVKYELPYLV